MEKERRPYSHDGKILRVIFTVLVVAFVLTAMGYLSNHVPISLSQFFGGEQGMIGGTIVATNSDTSVTLMTEKDNYAYMLLSTGNDSGRVVIYDLTNPQKIVKVGQVDTGNAPNTLAENMIVSTGYLYLTTTDNATAPSGYLEIYNVTDPTHPTMISKTEIPLDKTVITVSQNDLYITDGPDNIKVYDVSNPARPVFLETIETHIDTVTDMIAQNGKLYLSGYNGSSTSASDGHLETFAIGDPVTATPVQLSDVNTAGSPANIYLYGNDLYGVNYEDAYAGTLQVFDVQDAQHPYSIATTPIAGNPLGIAISGNTLYTSISEGEHLNSMTSKVQAFDISNPETPTSLGTFSSGKYLIPYFNIDHEFLLTLVDSTTSKNESLKVLDLLQITPTMVNK